MPLAKIDARTRSGRIDLALPESAKFELKATTNRGDLNNEYGAALKTEYENDRRHEAGGSISGSIGQNSTITVTTDRGTVSVRKDAGGPPPPPRFPKPPKAPGVTSIEIEKHLGQMGP
jgi:DUF4097 and DUF4098 domain-containing protein YvlB